MLTNKTLTEDRQEITKKQEFKRIGSTRKKNGQHLYAKSNETGNVYRVPIETRTEFHVGKGEQGTHKAVVNPNHKTLWALNMENALRKFNR